MKFKLVATSLFLGATLFAQVSIGIHIGRPPAPRIVRVQPVSPGPGYFFIQGYWYPVSGHYKWHDGYWSRPPYEGAHWVAPEHNGQVYLAGHWDGDRGRIEHDHRWDNDRDRRDHDREEHR